MKLTFLGAAREVTGSRFLLEAAGKKIMIDYGMEQGADLFENAPLPCRENEIDMVLLTHAHVDHTGYLPFLYRNGFRGPVYATATTADLCRVMLLDSAHIQESDAEWKNRKAQRSGKPPVEPLYTTDDAQAVLQNFVSCRYGESIALANDISMRMVDVGHLFGSASIELTVSESGETRVIVFSGDIGNTNLPLLKDPEYLHKADIVVMESTYGDRTHGPMPDYLSDLTQVLQETFDRGGNVVIPSFAVGRTQEILYFIRQIKEEGRVHGHDGFEVFVDSPMGIEATRVFTRNQIEVADEEAMALIRSGINPLEFDGLRIASSSEESKQINDMPQPKVIISASGMCDAGRVRHHLKHNLWRPESTILFVGYQSVGTLGRSLLDGVEKVKLFGESVQVKAQIRQLAGISGHADQNGLLRWIGSFTERPGHVFVVHGEDETAGAFAEQLRTELGLDASAPYNGESWDLLSLLQLAEGNKTRLKKPTAKQAAENEERQTTPPQSQKQKKDRKKGQTQAYKQLLAAVEKLELLVEKAEKRSAREQRELASRLNQFIRKNIR